MTPKTCLVVHSHFIVQFAQIQSVHEYSQSKHAREAQTMALTYNDDLDMYKQHIKRKQTRSNMHSVKSNFSH